MYEICQICATTYMNLDHPFTLCWALPLISVYWVNTQPSTATLFKETYHLPFLFRINIFHSTVPGTRDLAKLTSHITMPSIPVTDTNYEGKQHRYKRRTSLLQHKDLYPLHYPISRAPMAIILIGANRSRHEIAGIINIAVSPHDVWWSHFLMSGIQD